MRVIINADDFALNENVSLAICECFRCNLITQTTVMVNMPFFHKALAMAKSAGIYGRIGLHLNLTYGFPLTDDIKRSPLFCNSDGSFSAAFHLSSLHRLWLPDFERRAVAREIEAQMEHYVKAGFSLMHLDSHHHSHTDFSIASIAVPLARRFGFRSIRLSRNFAVGSSLKRLYKNIVNRRFSKSGMATSDYFIGGSFANGRMLLASGSDTIAVELMVHPRFEHIEGSYGMVSSLQYDFKRPVSELSDWVQQMRDKNVRFITSAELRSE